jgi:hypothetical protein
MSVLTPGDFENLYARFQAPVSTLDCGNKCAPYNEYGVPFCCDTHHAVPTAYLPEWRFLQQNTNLWHLWIADTPGETNRLCAETPQEQILIECLGHEYCQRDYRSITCRAFPFFPYITNQGEFLGLSYYWQFEDRCWVISHLDVVTQEYRTQFIATYGTLFDHYPFERENFRHQSIMMRKVFGRQKRAIPLLHRNGKDYLMSTSRSRLQPFDLSRLPQHEPYKTAAQMPFPDEISQ